MHEIENRSPVLQKLSDSLHRERIFRNETIDSGVKKNIKFKTTRPSVSATSSI